jgi:hypothetical protein
MDYTKLTWNELALVILNVWVEMKRRNPIGINMYGGALSGAYNAVKEIAEAELDNPTSEE